MCRRNFAASRHHDLTSLSNPITHSDTRPGFHSAEAQAGAVYQILYNAPTQKSVYQANACLVAVSGPVPAKESTKIRKPPCSNVPMFHCSTLFQCSSCSTCSIIFHQWNKWNKWNSGTATTWTTKTSFNVRLMRAN